MGLYIQWENGDREDEDEDDDIGSRTGVEREAWVSMPLRCFRRIRMAKVKAFKLGHIESVRREGEEREGGKPPLRSYSENEDEYEDE